MSYFGWSLVTDWLGIFFLLGIMATLTVWSRAKSKARWLAVAYIFVGGPLAFFTLIPVMGKPVPAIKKLTVPTGQWEIIGFKGVKDKVMYLMLDMGDGAPVMVSIPWKKDNAERMQQIQNKDGHGLYDPGDDQVRPMPQPPILSPKVPNKPLLSQ